jgi:hypothetical protein
VGDGLATPRAPDSLAEIERALAVLSRRERLCEHLDGWSPEQHEELARVLSGLARDLAGDPPR